VDTQKDAVIATIADTPGIHGIIPATPGRVFTSNGRGNNASIVDAKTLQTISKVETEGNPDFIMFEPKQKEVYTFNGAGKSATVIGAESGKVVATIPLGGKPEAAVSDAAEGRVYVNIEDENTLAVIDIAKHAVVATWPIAPGEEASGLALDPANHRLFVGCSNKLMLMIDATTGKVLSSVPIGPGVDANAFDPGTGLAFASSSDGTLTVAQADGAGKLTVIQTLATPPRSRTMTLDPMTHRLYVASAEFTPPPPPGPDGRPQRPQVAPGTFKVVVYGMPAQSGR
jgi:DNA-binding beta-propeller fold protein YncE